MGSFTPKNDEWQYSVEQPITWGSHEGAGNTFPSDITWKVAHDCNVTILVGTGLISVSGTSSIYNEVECWAGIKYHAMSEDVWVKATINWGLEITLQPLSGSGALEAKTVWHISDPVTKNGGDFLGQFEHVVNPNVDREAASLAKTLTSLLVDANIQARVNQVLSGYNAFFFPGANTFDFYNPVFNANRDLIATITIRGL